MSRNGETDGMHRFLVWTAILTFALVAGITTYAYIFESSEERGMLEYRRGNLRLEDGRPEEALREFETVLRTQPDHAPSHLGRALALMAMQRDEQALEAFAQAEAIDPRFAPIYANRGILRDRMGHYKQAISDYRKALRLDPELGEGPDWLTRFLRNQYEAPPTIADRADYLESELAKPAGERVLRVPELDQEQRSYKVEGTLDQK